MRKSLFWKLILSGVMATSAMAALTVDKSNGVLTVTSDVAGIVIAKVVGPNDNVVVDERYEGDTFSWTPSGENGAYRFDVNVVPAVEGEGEGAYAGGSIEVANGQMIEN